MICAIVFSNKYSYATGISKESCLWYVPHLEEGIDLIQLLDPNQEDTVQVCPGN